MKRQFDSTKPCQTRDGRKVEIISTNGRAPWVIVGYIEDSEAVYKWLNDGSFCADRCFENPNDLVNIRRKREAWVNLYRSGDAGWHDTEDKAHDKAGPTRIACVRVRVEWEEE